MGSVYLLTGRGALEEVGKEVLGCLIVLKHIFGVPLDGKDLVGVDGFNRFWDLVICTGGNLQTGGNLVEGLVVARVNVGAAPGQLEQAAPRHRVNVVGGQVAGCVLRVL